MTSAQFASINSVRLAAGKQPLTFIESPRKLPKTESAASLLAGMRENEVKKKTAKLNAANAKGSHLEQRFIRLWTDVGGPTLKREVKFHPARKWRFDFAHIPSKTAFELQGGNWSNGAHNRGGGMERDCEKALAAWHLGWAVIPLTPNLITAETIGQFVKKLSLP